MQGSGGWPEVARLANLYPAFIVIVMAIVIVQDLTATSISRQVLIALKVRSS